MSSAAQTRKLAVVPCMDARIDARKVLDLAEGDAHVIRNAGGVVSDDVIPSLAIGRRNVLIPNTDCGMATITEDGFKQELLAATGLRPPWAVEASTDADEDVRKSIARIRPSPSLAHTDAVRGYVLDVDSRELRDVP